MLSSNKGETVPREKKTQENPLLGRNIPPAPPPVVPAPAAPTTVPTAPRTWESSPAETTEPQASERENATIELSLYLRPSQDDKLEDLRRTYKKATKGKKISANEVMRRLIDRAKLEDIL